MLENYLPIIVFIFLGVAFGVGLTVVGYLLGPSNPDDEKNSQFECGFPAFDDSRMHFNIRYYLVAILFIIFDLEAVYFFPWCVSLSYMPIEGFWGMLDFIIELLVGFIYAWEVGALEWD